MIEVRDKGTQQLLGNISAEELQALIDHLEEQNTGDQDYYIDEPTIDMMAEGGAPDSILDFLRRSLGAREGMEIIWARR